MDIQYFVYFFAHLLIMLFSRVFVLFSRFISLIAFLDADFLDQFFFKKISDSSFSFIFFVNPGDHKSFALFYTDCIYVEDWKLGLPCVLVVHSMGVVILQYVRIYVPSSSPSSKNKFLFQYLVLVLIFTCW